MPRRDSAERIDAQPTVEACTPRLTLYMADRLGVLSRERAQSTRNSRSDICPAQIADELRTWLLPDGEAVNVLEAIKLGGQRRDRGHDKRAIVRAVAVFLSVAIPIGFVGYAQHVRHTVGLNWLSALAVLVALSLVIATAVISSRR